MNGDEIEVRLLSSQDIGVLENVDEEVFDHAVDRGLAAEFLAEPTHSLCVAIDHGLVVGMASAVRYVHPDKKAQLWINEVGVSGRWRNRGVAKKILDALLDHGRKISCTEAWVLTDADNRPARALYRSAGGIESEQLMVTFDLKTAR
ncbi:MAG: GNAT family N-acetyltransferase [Caulobacteraceae bacterium]